MGVKGDFSAARQLSERLRQIPKAVDQASKEIAREVHMQIVNEFGDARDTAGRPWTTARSGPNTGLTAKGWRKRTLAGIPTDLQKTGSLVNSIKVAGRHGKVHVTGSPLAALYQYAWKTATFLPWRNNIGVWRETIEAGFEKAIKEHLRVR